MLSISTTEPQPYWANEVPSDAEIRDAEKRHLDAFDSSDIAELIEADDQELLFSLRHNNISAVGSILTRRYKKLIDDRVEFSVYGRVLDKVALAAGRVA